MKKLCLLCFLVIGLSWVWGGVSDAVENRLTDQSDGQLIYSWHQGAHELKVRIFRGLCDDGKWRCSDLNMTQEYNHPAKNFTVLPLTEKSSSDVITTYALYMLGSCQIPDQECCMKLALELVLWKGGERSVSIRRYLSAQGATLGGIYRNASKALNARSAERRALLAKIKDALEQDNEVAKVLTRLADRGDFFAAVCLYNHFCKNVKYALQNTKGTLAILDIVEKWGMDIANAYTAARSGDSQYVAAYKKLFPKNIGSWMNSEAVTMKEMNKYTEESYKMGFLKTQSLSSFCDFEQWGVGMLYVLKMLPGSCETADNFGKEFEEALKRYEDNKEQFGR